VKSPAPVAPRAEQQATTLRPAAPEPEASTARMDRPHSPDALAPTPPEEPRQQVAALPLTSREVGARTLGLPDPSPPGALPSTALLLAVQTQLRRLGCYAGEPGGQLDTATRSAIAGFRVQRGLAPGETADENLINLLKEASVGSCTMECRGAGSSRTGASCMVRWRPDSPDASRRVVTSPKTSDGEPGKPRGPVPCGDILERAQLGELSAADRVLLREACR
jgi:hypothetical protein